MPEGVSFCGSTNSPVLLAINSNIGLHEARSKRVRKNKAFFDIMGLLKI